MTRLFLFGGKGGVGKTTTSCAFAIRLADLGLRTLLVSSDPAHSTSDSLDVEVGPEVTPIPGMDSLFGIELDPSGRLDAFLPNLSGTLSAAGRSPLASMLGQEGLEAVSSIGNEVKGEELLFPGLDEAMAFDELLRFVEDPNWDAVVFDTAPTGHALRFLGLPELIEAWTDRLLRLHRAMGGLRSMLFGRKEQDAMREELERLSRRVLRVRRILKDPDVTTFTLVTIPEVMALNETRRAHRALVDLGIPTGAVVVNRLTPAFDHPFLSERRDVEQSHLKSLDLDGLEVIPVELAPQDVRGFDALRAMSTSMLGPSGSLAEGIGPMDLDPKGLYRISRGIQIARKEGAEVTVSLRLPGAKASDLGLRANGEDLLLDVNGREHRIHVGFPASTDASEASLKNGVLHLSLQDPNAPRG